MTVKDYEKRCLGNLSTIVHNHSLVQELEYVALDSRVASTMCGLDSKQLYLALFSHKKTN